MNSIRGIYFGVALSLALASCGQSPATNKELNQTPNDVPPAHSTHLGNVAETNIPVNVNFKFTGYLDSKGNSISSSEAKALIQKDGVFVQSDNIPPDVRCAASIGVNAYFFSFNVYGRIQFDCFEIGGRFDGIGYGSVRITDPGGSFSTGFQVSGIGSQHAEVLSGAVNKINGRYVVQGSLEATYSKPAGQYVRIVYQLDTRPFEARDLVW